MMIAQLRHRLAAASVAAWLPLAMALAQTGQQVPCAKAIRACEHWVTVAGGPARSKVYATYPLDSLNSSVIRGLVMVHGGERDAERYFETATAAAFLAGALTNTIVVAPRFPADSDARAANEALWSAGGANTWRAGGSSSTNPSLTTFDVMDEVLRALANKRTFPNLTRIVVAGHSAGGQFANRYAMANRVHEAAGVSLSYVVANPSSYAWPVAIRPLPTGDADPFVAEKAALGAEGGKVRTNYTFGPYDALKAPDFNRWPAGFEGRVGYSARLDDDVLRRQLVARPTTYLLGQLDVLPIGGFDASPRGMAQGPTRRARGEAFFKYVTHVMGAKHKAMIVAHCGHTARCIFTNDGVLPVIFPPSP
jgi:pimeloyl-ACP methyl ester carboxylesterase